MVLKELENHRAIGNIGSSLQAHLIINVDKELYSLLSSLGSDLKFVYMVSKVTLNNTDKISVEVIPSNDTKCERCWHYDVSIGTNSEHSTICNRCVENIVGNGEIIKFA
jgi:isoleucyl-tRNA synthetase